jgi:hypothetical protein
MSEQLLELLQRCLGRVETLVQRSPVELKFYDHLVDHAAKMIVRSIFFCILNFDLLFRLDLIPKAIPGVDEGRADSPQSCS